MPHELVIASFMFKIEMDLKFLLKQVVLFDVRSKNLKLLEGHISIINNIRQKGEISWRNKCFY